jgi:hypothetical protein
VALDVVLSTLLVNNPSAPIYAIQTSGLFTAMPRCVPLTTQRLIQDHASALELVVPADALVVVDGWTRRGKPAPRVPRCASIPLSARLARGNQTPSSERFDRFASAARLGSGLRGLRFRDPVRCRWPHARIAVATDQRQTPGRAGVLRDSFGPAELSSTIVGQWPSQWAAR